MRKLLIEVPTWRLTLLIPSSSEFSEPGRVPAAEMLPPWLPAAAGVAPGVSSESESKLRFEIGSCFTSDGAMFMPVEIFSGSRNVPPELFTSTVSVTWPTSAPTPSTRGR